MAKSFYQTNSKVEKGNLNSTLLLGFDDESPSTPQVYIAPISRLTAVYQTAAKLHFYFLPAIKSTYLNDHIELDITDVNAAKTWRRISNMLQGSAPGENIVWMNHELHGIPEVSGITITLGGEEGGEGGEEGGE
jgi:hypothetical protein